MEMDRNDYNNTISRCVIVGGADIADYERIRSYLREGDYLIYCDSGLRHMEGLGAEPSLIVGDFDSYDDPHFDIETITLPVAKDDTDTVFAMREGMRRGFKEFLLLGVIGARFDHSLVNMYSLVMLDHGGSRGTIIDDYSEIELMTGRTDEDGVCIPGAAKVPSEYPYFSLIAVDGPATGVTIRNAKFPLEDAVIGPEYQYGLSNEALPDQTAEIELMQGRLLLIKIVPGAAERHDSD